MGTKNNPGAFDCYANAEPDEPMFVLLGRDPCASLLVKVWIEMRRRMLDDPTKLLEARDCADAMLQWAVAKGKKDKVADAAHALAAVGGRL